MTSGCGDEPEAHAAGGPARHIPVLRAEVIDYLAPQAGGFYVDGTFGAGGYTRAILAVPGTRVLALDRDPTAIAAGRPLVAASAGRLDLAEARFSTLAEVVRGRGIEAIDGIVLDIGVSSMQIDAGPRGFSFRQDGPLDMRMEMRGRSAADIVNGTPEEELANLIFQFGEERASRRIARAIIADRAKAPFLSTKQLADMIARIMPARGSDIHPATRTFQALRIAVNDELGELAAALAAAETLLKPEGRLVVVSFHSLEDRIVKTFLAAGSGRGEAPSRRLPGEPEPPTPTFLVPRGQPIAPGETEVRQNPRARSAKLRFGIRTAAPPRGRVKARS